ncbi:aliphatic amidase amiE [Dehalogenimonas sp. WBC-2]|nr:aliphatic amidase amiE [Dehalogenimonas sp. WBC-2]
MAKLKVALLHIDPRPGELSANRALIERNVRLAASAGAKFVITPELAESGYHFADYIGTNWLGPESDLWLKHMTGLAGQLGITILLATAEHDDDDHTLYNSVFVLSPEGKVAGTHRKINIHRAHCTESWADTGKSLEVIELQGLKLGILICADAWNPDLAAGLAAKGADIIVSVANWGETPCPPESCWEKRSQETGVPVWVCNRTGVEHALSFEDASSLVAVDGKRLIGYSGPGAAILLFDWDIDKKAPLQTEFEVVLIS